MGEPEVRAFLTNLANDRKVAASTQNQALNALIFLYQKVLRQELSWVGDFERAPRPTRIPEVLTREENMLVERHASLSLFWPIADLPQWQAPPAVVQNNRGAAALPTPRRRAHCRKSHEMARVGPGRRSSNRSGRALTRLMP